VLVIIILIVGGGGQGADLQIEKFNQAVNTFREKYEALPGDLNAATASTFECVGPGDVLIFRAGVHDDAILHKDGAGGLLEEDVAAVVAGVELALYLAVEVVLAVLSLPVAAGQVELVDEAGVDADAALVPAGHLVFGHNSPAELAAALLQQVFKGTAEVAFVVEAELAELCEGFVIGADGRVVGLEGEVGHTGRVYRPAAARRLAARGMLCWGLVVAHPGFARMGHPV
jgi:hypothetical protein